MILNHKWLLQAYFDSLWHSSDLVNYKPTIPIHAKCVANSKMKVLAKILAKNLYKFLVEDQWHRKMENNRDSLGCH